MLFRDTDLCFLKLFFYLFVYDSVVVCRRVFCCVSELFARVFDFL